ncbi:MAG: hypothetical protein NTX88_09310 [Candidatus Atribacteria bacterium]|nr:hypothetical protein [Candidatus Atribacteria bacterium]
MAQVIGCDLIADLGAVFTQPVTEGVPLHFFYRRRNKKPGS